MLNDCYWGPYEKYLKALKDEGVSEKDVIKLAAKRYPGYFFKAEGFFMLEEAGFRLSSVVKEYTEQIIPGYIYIPDDGEFEEQLCFMELIGRLDHDDAERYLEIISPDIDQDNYFWERLDSLFWGFTLKKFEESKHFKGWARITRYYLEKFVGFDDDYQIYYLSEMYDNNQELAIKFSAELVNCKEKYERYFEHLEEILSKIDHLRDEKELKTHYYEIAKTILGSIK